MTCPSILCVVYLTYPSNCLIQFVELLVRNMKEALKTSEFDRALIMVGEMICSFIILYAYIYYKYVLVLK